MEEKRLKGKKIAILATDGFEEVELTKPRQLFESDAAETVLISNKPKITAWDFGKWTNEYKVDVLVKNAETEDYDLLLLPGGVINPDKLRRDKTAVEFVKKFVEAGKPVGAICHGPQLLIEAGVVKGKVITSFHSIKTDLMNAGAEWIDADAVIDKNIITSRTPDDIPAFYKRMVEVLFG